MFKRVHVFRVRPGQELASQIHAFCQRQALSSGVVLGVVGSVTQARLNYLVELPGGFVSEDFEGPLEIVAAQGSVATREGETIVHIHMQLSGREMSRGGHLAQATVFSTAEVVIGELDYALERQADAYTGLNELADGT